MEKAISAVQYDDEIIQVRLQKVTKHPVYIAKIFEIISKQGVNIDMISQVMLEEDVQIEFTCGSNDQQALNTAIEKLKETNEQMEIYQNKMVSKVSVEGKGMEQAIGVAAAIFSLFGANNIPFYQVTTSSTSISYIIDKDKRGLAVDTIKAAYHV